jgi:hypothetical protein
MNPAACQAFDECTLKSDLIEKIRGHGLIYRTILEK